MVGKACIHGAAAFSLAIAPWFLSPAAASFVDGNKLYSDCTTREASGDYAVNTAVCLGYLTGVYDDLELDRARAGQDSCSGGITAGQLRDVVTRYLRDHPRQRHWDAALLVRHAIMGAWPDCTPRR